jgi:RHS repeat-associated protein
VLKSDGIIKEYLYLHRDYQSSIVAISNSSGVIIEKRHFDAWGQVVRVQDAQGNILAGLSVLDRGYTGHEHLQSVGLIHMNGRLYDAKLHRFLQPDNFIQEPYNTQNYNRYGYVLNNPLKYTDPSGEEAILAAIIVGAIIGATSYTLTALLTDVPFSVGGFLKSTFMGALSGAVTFGIGNAAQGIKELGARFVFQAFAHGSSQAVLAGIQGGDMLAAFASGALSSMASGLWAGGAQAGEWKGLGGTWAKGDFGTVAFGTISGGAGASLTGGNFWQGAATGLVVSGLNHAMHRMNGNTEISVSKYNKLSDAQKSKYQEVPKDAIIQVIEQTAVSIVTPSGAVTVKNLNVTEIWGKTKLVLKKNLIRSTTSSNVLESKFGINTVTQIFYRTFEYSNSFFTNFMTSVGNVLYPSDVSLTIYNSSSRYTGGYLSKYLTYLK